MAAAAGDNDALDRGLADSTTLPFAAVDAVFKLEKSFFAVGIDIVRNRGTAEGNRFLQDFLQTSAQFCQRLARDGCGTAARANASTEQRFIGVDVPDPP